MAVIADSGGDHRADGTVVEGDVRRGVEEREVGSIEQKCLLRGASLAEHATTFAAMLRRRVSSRTIAGHQLYSHVFARRGRTG